MNKKMLVLILIMIFTNIIPFFPHGEKQYDVKLEELISKTTNIFNYI